MSYKKCPVCKRKITNVDFRDASTLNHFVTSWSKMKSSYETGTCAKHQRVISEAIKRARYMAIMPYVNR